MNNVILYSIGCPTCNVLEKKLNQSSISFEIIKDEEIMKSKGYLSLPILEVDGEAMKFPAAIEWIKNTCQVSEDKEKTTTFTCDTCSIEPTNELK